MKFKLQFIINLLVISHAFGQFLPNNLENITLWLKADSDISSTNDTIDSWGNVLNVSQKFVQNTKALRPKIKENRYLNRVVSFDNSYLLFDETINIGSCFIICNWATDASTFPSFNGLITQSTGNDNDLLFVGVAATANFYNGFFSNNLYMNGLLTQNFDPLNVPKIVYGKNVIPRQFNNLQVGRDRQDNSRFWQGDIAEIIIYSQPLADSNRIKVEKYLMNKYAPPISLGKDTIITSSICKLTLGQNKYLQYTWSTGETSPAISVNKSGTYAVEVIDIFGRKSSDTINVTYLQKAPVLENAEYCEEITYQLDTKLPNNNYFFKWNTGDKDSLLNISKSGKYYVEILDKSDTNNCRITSDTVQIIRNDFSSLKAFGNDTTLCNNTILGVLPEAAKTAKSFNWSTGSTSNNISINKSGSYSVQITNDLGCLLKDTINTIIDETKNAPIAIFNLNDTICVGQPYTLADLSTSNGSNLASRLWQFSDGSANDSLQINKTFADSGNVVVSLRVTAADGCVGLLSKRTTVLSPPQPNFTFPDISCMGNVIQFINTSKTRPYQPLGYNWSFNDPSSGVDNTSSLINPIHSFNASGNYNVSLSLSDRYKCSASKSKTITIRPTPTVDFSFGTSCQGSATLITDKSSLPSGSSAISYFWNLGDGTTSTTIGSLSKVYGSSGTKTVGLNIQASNGCGKAIQKSLVVIPIPQPVISNIGNCVGLPIQFADSSKAPNPYTVTNRIWTINRKNQGTKKFFNFTYDTIGTINVQLQAFVGTCSATSTKNISVNPRPSSNFTIDNPYGNKPFTPVFTNLSQGFTQSNWDFKTGDLSTQNTPTYVFDTNGTFNVELIVKNNFGCTDTSNKLIYVYPDRLDVAVNLIDVIENSFGIQPRFELKNLGNKPIYQMVISIFGQNDESTIYKEWNGLLLPNETTTITLDVLLSSDTQKWAYVCAKAGLVNQKDIDLSNNTKCKLRTQSFEFYNPYFINTNELLLSFSIPSADDLTITIYDPSGKLILNQKIELLEGVQTSSILTPNLQSGIYNVTCQYQGQVKSKRFLKLN